MTEAVTEAAEPIKVKVRITRAWTKLAPKLIAFLATGLTASGLIAFLAELDIVIPTGLASTIVTVVAAIAGYIKSDTALAGAVAIERVDTEKR